jgi:hypothetical protein
MSGRFAYDSCHPDIAYTNLTAAAVDLTFETGSTDARREEYLTSPPLFMSESELSLRDDSSMRYLMQEWKQIRFEKPGSMTAWEFSDDDTAVERMSTSSTPLLQ